MKPPSALFPSALWPVPPPLSTGPWEQAWAQCLLPRTPSPAVLAPAARHWLLPPHRAQELDSCYSWIVWLQGGGEGSQLPASLSLPESFSGLGSISAGRHGQRAQAWLVFQKHERIAQENSETAVCLLIAYGLNAL